MNSLENIIPLVLCIIYKANGNVSYQSTVLSATTPALLPVLTTTTAFTEADQTVNLNANRVQTEVPPTPDPGTRLDLPSSNLSPISHHPETSPAPQQPQSSNSEISDARKESNSMNDIFTDDNTLFNTNERTTFPGVENNKDIPSVTPEPQATPYEETEAFLEETAKNREKDGSLGLEPWKIGVISAAVFLATEAVVLAIYCIICRKRRNSIAMTCDQHSEAGETIHVESNGNTEMGAEGTIDGGTSQNAVDCAKPMEHQDTQQQSSEREGTILNKFTLV